MNAEYYIDELEKQFYRLPVFKNYAHDVGNWVKKNYKQEIDQPFLKRFNDYLDTLLPDPSSAESIIIKAFLLGKLIVDSQKMPVRFNIDLGTLPDTIKEAVREYKLTSAEVEALKYSQHHTAIYISNANDSIKSLTKEIVLKNVSTRTGSYADIAKELQEAAKDKGDMGIKWYQVAMYEVNSAYANGYLAHLGPGQFVVGYSLPGACNECMNLINGKIYKVIEPPEPIENHSPGSKEYIKLAKIYDTCVWVGKNNIGRYRAKIPGREHHELLTPTLPMHVLCRCRYFNIIPSEQYLDNKGKMQFRVDNPKEHQKWYTNFQKHYPLAA